MMKYGVIMLLAQMVCTQAYVYQVQVIQSRDSQARPQVIIGLSDFHDKMHPANNAQRTVFLNMLSSIKQRDSYVVITEDLSSPNVYGAHQVHQYTISSRQGMLAGLTQDCQKRGVATYNLEYRYGRVIAFGQLLHQPLAHPFQHQPACIITIADLLDEVEKMASYVHQSLVGQQSNALFVKQYAKMKKAIKRLELSQYRTSSCAAFLHCCTTQVDRTAFLKELLTFDSCLIDCAMVDHIAKAQQATHVIVVAGGTHITRTFEHLKNQGYTQSFCSALALEQPRGLTTMVSAGTLKQGERPAAIDISCLRQFIK